MPSTDNKPLPVTEGQPAMTMTQVMEMMKAFASELKAPSAEESEKKAAEKSRREENVRILVQEAKDFNSNRKATQRACSHSNGRSHTFVGQVFNNGDAVALCSICQKDYKWKATMEQLQQGVDPHQWPNLTEAMLLQLEKAYPATVPAERIKLASQAGEKVA